MKRLFSLLLVVVMVLSLGTVIFAETWGETTTVTYSGKYQGGGGGTGGTEEYDLTIPATIVAGGDAGIVTLTGHWPSNRQVVVDADDKVTLSNGSDSEDVAVTFSGITKKGSNISELEASESISVAEPLNAYFGEWQGVLTYTVVIEDAE